MPLQARIWRACTALSSVMYILSGKKITAVYPMSRHRWDQNITQVANRLNRARATYVRLLHVPPCSGLSGYDPAPPHYSSSESFMFHGFSNHLKIFTWKGTLWQVLIKVLNCCPSDLLSGSTLPPSALPSVQVQYCIYRQCLAGRGGDVESCWRPYSTGV